MKTNLGFTPDYALETATPKEGGKPSKPPVYYPHFTVEGKAADKLMPNLEAGQTITATVTMKVTGRHERVKSREQYGGDSNSRIEFEVTNIDIDGADTSTADDEDDAGNAVDSYLASKSEGGDEDA